jgi:hypothetical protein
VTWRTELVERHRRLFYAHGYEHASGYPSVGDGWQLIVEKAFKRIEAAVGKFLRKNPAASVHVSQIKEKLGGLRIYIHTVGLPARAEALVQDAVDLAEARASCTCEICGAAGVLHDHAGWYLTRCERHAEGEPVPAQHGEADLHIQFKFVRGKMRVSRCRRYDRERDAFVDAPLPPDETWAEGD